MNADQLLRALQINDTLFPTGAFAYSDGLEMAVAAGLVRDAATLDNWLCGYLDDVFVPCEGLAIRQAMTALDTEDYGRLVVIDQELTALRPAAASRSSSQTVGTRLLKSVLPLYADARLRHIAQQIEAGTLTGNLPVIYAAVAQALPLSVGDALLCFGYTRLAGLVSAALRTLALGQQEAQASLTRALAGLPDRVRKVADVDGTALRSFVPMLDVLQMQHRCLYSRMFRS